MKRLLVTVLSIMVCLSLVACSSGLKAPSGASEYSGQNYEDVVAGLQKAGFTNIDTTAIDDLSSNGNVADGAVETVAINGDTAFEANASFAKDSSVVVTYHTIKKLSVPFSTAQIQSKPYHDIASRFEEVGFTSISTNEVYDLDPDTIQSDYVNEVTVNGSTEFAEGDELPFDAEVLIICHYPYEKYKVNLHINFIPNLIFNKYDIDILVDGEKQYTNEHGKDADYELSLKEGTHIFTFTSCDSASVKGEASLDVTDDVDVSYEISCYSDKVEVTTEYTDYKTELKENEVKMTNDRYHFSGMNYNDVISELKEIGFTNIKEQPAYDIVFGITTEGSVSKVTIAENTDYKRGDILDKDAEVIVSYHLKEESDPTRIVVPAGSEEYEGKDYTTVEQQFKEMGFTNIKTVESTTNDHRTGLVDQVSINSWSFSKGDSFKPDSSVTIRYWKYEAKAPAASTESKSVSYSTNDQETAKAGNSGVFAYKSKGGETDNYYIIDFDEGYVYYFCDGDGSGSCDRLKIDSGDLNSGLTITYHDGDTVWSEWLHFRWSRQPDHLIVEDHNHCEYDYYTTSLSGANGIKSSRTIVDY